MIFFTALGLLVVVVSGGCLVVVVAVRGFFMMRRDRYGYTVVSWPRWFPHRHQWKAVVVGYDYDTGTLHGRQCTRCRLTEEV